MLNKIKSCIEKIQYSSMQIGIMYFMLTFSTSCSNEAVDTSANDSPSASEIKEPSSLIFTVLNSMPHDTAAFTQGLEIYNGKFIESTGLNKQSSLRIVEMKSGKVLKQINNEDAVFAEGVTVFNDTIYQLSWQNHQVFLYDAKNFKQLGTLPWSGEGWGITHDEKNLIISEGSDKLYFVEPATLKLNKVLSVSDNYGSVNNLNELEMIDGYIFANRWQYDYIIKIDPKTGFVVGKINMKDFLQKNSKFDLSYLSKPGTTATESGAVLNGIAYDSISKKLYITGKLWPEIFEIKLD
jgi:glutamine cyclotransferase